MVVQTGEPPSPPLAAPDRSDSAVPDGLFLPNWALASAAGAAGGVAADAPTLGDARQLMTAWPPGGTGSTAD